MDLLNNLTIENLTIIGQSSQREVIFCYHTERRRIICFDQHAADERIRYETLLDNMNDLPNDLDSIKSQACHGAIRFGDKLSLKDCQDLIKRLLQCKVPFKCAHSRCGVCVLQNMDRILYLEKARENRNELSKE